MSRRPLGPVLLIALPSWLGGCAGVEIIAQHPSAVRNAHSGSAGSEGYYVYAPMLVIPVVRTSECMDDDNSGDCGKARYSCDYRTPFLVPDYSKPYLIRQKRGIGSSTLEVDIADGWRLDSTKSEVDPGSILDFVASTSAFGLAAADSLPGSSEGCPTTGLYTPKLDSGSGSMKLEKLDVHTGD